MFNEYSVDVSTLKKILIDKKLEKIGDFARESGVNRNTISAIFNGYKPSSDTMYKIAEALDLTPEMAGKIFFNQTYVSSKLNETKSAQEVKDMKITIETEPKEIADLIAALQGQQISKVKFRLATPKKISAEGSVSYTHLFLMHLSQRN